ncbi:MAG: hypothetical protein RSF40_07400 [Oscillospiraceae bacterium]
MNIIETVKGILNECPLIAQFTNDIQIDFTKDTPTNFGLSSSGDTLVKESITGVQTRRHNFILFAVNQSISDYDRLNNSTFMLDLEYYLEAIKGNAITATVGNSTKIGALEKLSCANAMLFSIPNGDINNGCVYQLQIIAEYKLNP